MRSANLRAAPALLAATLAGCGVTLPWTDESSSSAGDGAFTVSPTALTFHGQAGGATPAAQRLLVTVGAESAYRARAQARPRLRDHGARGRVRARAPGRGRVPRDGDDHGLHRRGLHLGGRGEPRRRAGHVRGHGHRRSDGARGLPRAPRLPAGRRRPGSGAADGRALAARWGGASAWYTCIGTWDTPRTWLTFTPGSGTGLPVTIEVTVHGGGLPAGTTRSASSASFYYQTVPCGQTSPNTVRVPLTFTISVAKRGQRASAGSVFGPDLNAASPAARDRRGRPRPGDTSCTSSRCRSGTGHQAEAHRSRRRRGRPHEVRPDAGRSRSASKSGPLIHPPAGRCPYSSSFAVCEGDSTPPSASIPRANASIAR
jgi:hypothetical protein